MAKIVGYCLKHKGKVEIKDVKFELNARGTLIAKGTCPDDGTAMTKILNAEERKLAPASLQAKAGKKGGRSRSRSRSAGKPADGKSRGKSRSRSRKSSRSGGANNGRRRSARRTKK